MAADPIILVVGSINMDLVVRTQHVPAPGETVLGSKFQTYHGGKGANQAVAVTRLGGRCHMIGRVGDDAFGEELLKNLANEGVECDTVLTTPSVSTGVAMILVDPNGENYIVVAGGANKRVSPDDLFANAEQFEQAAVVVLQMELPLPTVRTAVTLAKRYGCKIILDPAPASASMPTALYDVDILTPNVTEAEIITGVQAVEERIDKNVASDLIGRGVKTAVLKLGPRGSLVVTADGHFYRVKPYRVTVEDTTGAGDAFTAALAVATARGTHIHDAARLANAAGALACTKLGAQNAMPTAGEVKILMEDQPL